VFRMGTLDERKRKEKSERRCQMCKKQRQAQPEASHAPPEARSPEGRGRRRGEVAGGARPRRAIFRGYPPALLPMNLRALALLGAAVAVLAGGCRLETQTDMPLVSPTATTDGLAPDDSLLREKLAQYTTVRLTADLSGLSDSTRQMIPHLIEAARAMDEVFWMEAYPAGRDSLLHSLDSEAA